SIAAAHRMLGPAGWITASATAVVFLLLGVVLATPARPLAELPGTVVEVLAGAVTGWKDLITVELPVGAYRNLLVPALAVFLLGPLFALLLAWRRSRASAWAVAVCLGMIVFGIAFGRPASSAALQLGPLAIPVPRELTTGAVALVLS